MTMRPIVDIKSSSMEPAQRLRQIIATEAVTLAPGVYDALSARLTVEAGFAIAYASGGSIVRSFGLPDLGLADPSMIAERLAQIVEAAGIPVVADADNGFGNERNVARVVRMYEQAGAAALHFEDQVLPKRCGLYSGIELISPAEMVGKIKAALDARRKTSTVIIARTDAVDALGLPQALDRAHRYAEAGADMLFVEGLRTQSELRAVGNAVRLPKILNCTPPGSVPELDLATLGELNFKILICPADLQCAAIAGMSRRLQALRELNWSSDIGCSLAERDRLVELERWLAVGAIET